MFRLSCFLLLLFFHIISNKTFSSSVYHIYKSSDLQTTFLRIWEVKKKERVNFAHVSVQILLHQGFYKLAADDDWAIDFLNKIKYHMVFKSYPSFITLTSVFSTGVTETTKEGSFAEVLLFLHNQFKKGFKVSGEIYYEAQKAMDLAYILQIAARNNSDTVIRLRFCEIDNCVHDAEVKRRIQRIPIPLDDGMMLTIHSKYSALELPKIEFFLQRFRPFVLLSE